MLNFLLLLIFWCTCHYSHGELSSALCSADGACVPEGSSSILQSAMNSDKALNNIQSSDGCQHSLDHGMDVVQAVIQELGNKSGAMVDHAMVIMSPVQQIMEQFVLGATEGASFQVKEALVVIESFSLQESFACNASGIDSGVAHTTLLTKLLTLPELVALDCDSVSNRTKHDLKKIIDLAGGALWCVYSGGTPLKTKEESQKNLSTHEAEIKSGSAKIPNFEGLSLVEQERMRDEVSVKRIKHTGRYLCQHQHRLDFLEAMRPGLGSAAKNFCDHGSYMSTLQTLNASDKIREFFQRSISGTALKQSSIPCQLLKYHGRRRGQASANIAEHPLRSKQSALYDTFGWWGERSTRNARDDAKAKMCQGASDSDMDKIFETDCVMNGCSSPVALPFQNIILPPCHSHDLCYVCGPYHNSRVKCDDDFYNNLMDECLRKLPGWLDSLTRGTCYTQAYTMYTAVWGAGWLETHPYPVCQTPCAQSVWKGPEFRETMKLLDPFY